MNLMHHKSSINQQDNEVSKAKKVIEEIVHTIRTCRDPELSLENRKEIERRMKDLHTVIRNQSLMIPLAALEPEKEECMNTFTKKNTDILEKKFSKYEAAQANFKKAIEQIDKLRKEENFEKMN